MAYSYNRLWKLMIDKKINKTTLRREAGITSNAMAKMGKDQPVSIEVLAKICRVLDCTLDDIVDFLWVDHDVAVGGVGLEAFTLEHTAVQQDLLAMVGGDEVLAARHFLGCTDEFDFHRHEICPKDRQKK